MSAFLIVYLLVVMATVLMVAGLGALTGLAWMTRRCQPWGWPLTGYFAVQVLAALFLAVTEFVPELEAREVRALTYRATIALDSLALAAWGVWRLTLARRNGHGGAAR